MAPHIHSNAESCVEAVLSSVGRTIVLVTPIALGKPNHFLNALFARAVRDSSISLKILTALSFVKPVAQSDLERRFAGPLVERLFGHYPYLGYAEALRRGDMPPNVEVHEFFMQAGAFLHAPLAQQNYSSMNYTHLAKFAFSYGVNVFGQLVAKRGDGEVSDLQPVLEHGRHPGRVARVDAAAQDRLACRLRRAGEQRAAIHGRRRGIARLRVRLHPGRPLSRVPAFCAAEESVSLQDHAAAIHAGALVKDGGTIQLGIGAFSDALTHALVLRQTRNGKFRDLANALGAGRLHPRLPIETAPFEKGLYGATEMFVDGYMDLYRSGILKRRAFDDIETQRRADAGELPAEEYARGALIHAGFLVGSSRFYEALRNLTEAERHAFRMTRISYTNQLYGNEELKRAQRPHARFINSTLMATLLGAAASDQLEDGRVVSGVGGQYNFVAMAHELEDGRSILELRSWRMEKDGAASNIRWTYGHTTIPRHLRDIFVTEYGAADVLGLSDRDTIAAMLNITDSRFQDGLLEEAKAAGKIEESYEIPEAFRNNTPQWIEKTLGPARADGTLPDYPFGTDFTPEETALLPALTLLKHAQGSPLALREPREAGNAMGVAKLGRAQAASPPRT